MTGGGIFSIVADERADHMLMATGLLNQRIKRAVESRDARIRTIHLEFTTWQIERKMIADRISESTVIISDIAGIIADCMGSAHGRAIDLIQDSHKHIFTSKFASVATQKERISAGELIGNFEQQLGSLGYRSTMVPCSTYGPDRATRKVILDLLNKIIVRHYNGANDHLITDMFYQVILLMWTDHTSTVEDK